MKLEGPGYLEGRDLSTERGEEMVSKCHFVIWPRNQPLEAGGLDQLTAVLGSNPFLQFKLWTLINKWSFVTWWIHRKRWLRKLVKVDFFFAVSCFPNKWCIFGTESCYKLSGAVVPWYCIKLLKREILS